MKITVYSAKGSAGKTPIATNIALDREYAIGTNEAFHVFDSFIPDGRLLALDLTERFPAIPGDIDIVFDLAGAISEHSHSITSALVQSDLVIVPIFNEVKSLNSGVGTLREVSRLKGFNGALMVVATKLQKQSGERFKGDWSQSRDFQNIAAAVKESGFDIPVLPLKFSKVFDAIFEKEMSIAQLREDDALAGFTYREVAAQFDEIYNHIDQIDHAKQNDLSALKEPPRKNILPTAETDNKPAARKTTNPVRGKAGAVGRPPKTAAEKRDYKITLSLTQAQGEKVRTKAGLASEAAVIYDHLEKTGFFD